MGGVVNGARGPVIHKTVNEVIRVAIRPSALLIVDLGTEIVGVGLDSVMAPVSDTNDYGEHLALRRAQR